MGKSKPPPPEQKAGPFNQAFAGLAALRSELPSVPLPEPVKEEAPAKGPARAVVRRERKGHGGKEVTVVEQLGLPAEVLEAWALALRKELGCGARVEEETLVLQGDQRARVEPLLLARGVRKVVQG